MYTYRIRNLGLSAIFILLLIQFAHSQDSVYSTYLLPKVSLDTALLASQAPDPYFFIDRYRVFESHDDSALIYEIFSGSMELDELEDIVESYQSFDDHRIHYLPRFDPLKKKDTTLIYLLDSGGTYVHPHNGYITSRFGPRKRYHYGVDVKLYTGDTVRSAFDGIVRISTYNRGGYGYLVIVRHNNGLETYYAHLSRLLVKPEQKVKAGDIIGLGGNTGQSRGAHLHWEIRYLGTPMDPEKVIDFKNMCLKSDTLHLSRALFSYLGSGKGGARSGKASYHRVRSGETLSSIARRYGTSVSNLQRLNGMGRSTSIRADRTIRVR